MTRAAGRVACRRPHPGVDQDGSSPIELVLGMALLLLPAAVLVALLPAWSERQSLAVVAATEAARTVAWADDRAVGHAAALRRVQRIAANHGMPQAVEGLAVTGDLVRGGAITAAVTVRIPLAAVPFVGETGGWSWTAQHTEPVDPYRSFPP